MNYQEHYNRLIERAKNRELSCYTESHHIIPRCMSGTDEKDNLVRLTAREHFIAHLLLHKIYPNESKLLYAINMMCVNSYKHLNNRVNNRLYSWLKEKFSKEISISQSGENNSQFGTMWIYNIQTNENKKISKCEKIPDGWLKGRNVNPRKKVKPKINCVVCNTELLSNKSKYQTCSSKCAFSFKQANGLYVNTFKNTSHNRNKGINNPMFGTKYIYNPITLEYKRSKDDELYELISLGWKFGQKPRVK